VPEAQTAKVASSERRESVTAAAQQVRPWHAFEIDHQFRGLLASQFADGPTLGVEFVVTLSAPAGFSETVSILEFDGLAAPGAFPSFSLGAGFKRFSGLGHRLLFSGLHVR
jgi:hypothetical protein